MHAHALPVADDQLRKIAESICEELGVKPEHLVGGFMIETSPDEEEALVVWRGAAKIPRQMAIDLITGLVTDQEKAAETPEAEK